MTRDEIKDIAIAAGLRPQDLDHFIATKPPGMPWTPEFVRLSTLNIVNDPRYADFAARIYDTPVQPE